jgi:hypothetical protein
MLPSLHGPLHRLVGSRWCMAGCGGRADGFPCKLNWRNIPLCIRKQCEKAIMGAVGGLIMERLSLAEGPGNRGEFQSVGGDVLLG